MRECNDSCQSDGYTSSGQLRKAVDASQCWQERTTDGSDSEALSIAARHWNSEKTTGNSFEKSRISRIVTVIVE